MQKRSCPVCESERAEIIMRFTPELLTEMNSTYDLPALRKACQGKEEYLTYSRCLDCSMVYCENLWDDTTLGQVYGETIDHVLSKKKQKTTSKRMHVHRLWLNILRVLSLTRTEFFDDLNVVDFGCGWGDFLDAADGYGVRVVGYDTDDQKTKLAIERGRRIVTSVEDIKSLGPYDVFVMNSVMEHLQNVSEVMTLVHGVLKPKGLFVSSVMDYRRGFIKKNVKRLGNGMPATTKNLNPLEHVNVYDYKSTLSTLRKYGFRFISTGHALTLTDLPRLRNKPSVLRIANTIENFCSRLLTSKNIGITVYATRM